MFKASFSLAPETQHFRAVCFPCRLEENTGMRVRNGAALRHPKLWGGKSRAKKGPA